MYYLKVKTVQNHVFVSKVDSFLVKTTALDNLLDCVRGNSGYNFLVEKNRKHFIVVNSFRPPGLIELTLALGILTHMAGECMASNNAFTTLK